METEQVPRSILDPITSAFSDEAPIRRGGYGGGGGGYGIFKWFFNFF